MPRLWTPHKHGGDQASLIRWAEARLPMRFDLATSIPVAVLHGDELVAVAVYHMHRGAGIEMAIAADTPRWATRNVISGLLAPPFEALGCRRISAIIHSANTRSRRFVEGIGFQYEGTLRDAYEDGDAIMYGMTRRWWLASRWNRYRDARKAA